MERDEDLEDGEMEDREREDGGGVANIYDEQSSAGGAAEISAAHPITSFIPPPVVPGAKMLKETKVLKLKRIFESNPNPLPRDL